MIYLSLDGGSGYAMAAQAYVEGLLRMGQPLSWSPRDFRAQNPGQVFTQDSCLRACLGQALATDRILFHVVPSQLEALYEQFSAYRKFVYTVWETSELPAAWVAPLNRAERIFVPCKWNVEVMQAAGVTTPIQVVPHLISQALADKTPAPVVEPFTFYCIGPWSRRKGLDLLVEAFCRAFAKGEPVRLLLKTGKRDLTRFSRRWALRHLLNAWNTSARALRRIQKSHRRPPPVQLLHGDWPQEQIWDLHTRSHCYVSLTRTEGWGLGAFEAATLGNPVIMTGYGGQLDFLDPSLAYLVQHRLVPCQVGPWEKYYTGQSWAEPDIEHAASLMLQVYSSFSQARDRAQQLKQRICREFGWQQVMPAFLAGLGLS